jgi:3-isopropylmalate dehydrogenase
MRFYFDQFVNLRPVKLFDGVETPLAHKTASDIDFVVIRENTEDFLCRHRRARLAGKGQAGAHGPSRAVQREVRP